MPTSEWKRKIKESQGYICPVCGKKGNDRSMDIHHCRNKCRGGKNTAENCVAVHKVCHAWIHRVHKNRYYDPRVSTTRTRDYGIINSEKENREITKT